MKYAVIAISGTQHQVREGDIITIDRIESKEGESQSSQQVLLISDDKSLIIGTPTIEKARVDYQILKHHLGKKIEVLKYKAKARYRRHTGFRSQLTDIKILKINP